MAFCFAAWRTTKSADQCTQYQGLVCHSSPPSVNTKCKNKCLALRKAKIVNKTIVFSLLFFLILRIIIIFVRFLGFALLGVAAFVLSLA